MFKQLTTYPEPGTLTEEDDTFGMLETMLLDFWMFKLRRVGRRNMSAFELWREWLEHG